MAQTKKRTSNSGGFLGGLLDSLTETQNAKAEAKFKVQQANAKLKSELIKGVLMKKMDEQSKIAGNPRHPQNPEQQYLMRRAREQNPLAQMLDFGNPQDPNNPNAPRGQDPNLP